MRERYFINYHQNAFFYNKLRLHTVLFRQSQPRQPRVQQSSSLPNIHVHPGGSGQPLRRAWRQPGAGWGTGRRFWQLQRTVSVERKDKSTTTDLHILWLKLYTFGSPGGFHLTGSLGRVKPRLGKENMRVYCLPIDARAVWEEKKADIQHGQIVKWWDQRLLDFWI